MYAYTVLVNNGFGGIKLYFGRLELPVLVYI